MRFRPCIDIHNGAVKQIVGGGLKDEADFAKDNFVSELKADFYADLYRRSGLVGGHIILLNPAGSTYYEADLEQAKLALLCISTGPADWWRHQRRQCRAVSGYGRAAGNRDILCI